MDFKNSVIIMTSNLLHREIAERQAVMANGNGKPAAPDRDWIVRALQQHFRPEFLNRIDDIVVFHSLSEEHVMKIVEIQLGRLRKLLAERKMQLRLTDAAKKHLAQVGYDPAFGARPIKRAIQSELQDPLANAILNGEYREGSEVLVDAVDGELVLK